MICPGCDLASTKDFYTEEDWDNRVGVDVRWLIAEVERLRAEKTVPVLVGDEAVNRHARELEAEVERLWTVIDGLLSFRDTPREEEAWHNARQALEGEQQ